MFQIHDAPEISLSDSRHSNQENRKCLGTYPITFDIQAGASQGLRTCTNITCRVGLVVMLTSSLSRLTAGYENLLLHYLTLDTGRGVMISPLPTTPTGTMQAELLRCFYRSCLAVQEVLRQHGEEEEEEEDDTNCWSDEEEKEDYHHSVRNEAFGRVQLLIIIPIK